MSGLTVRHCFLLLTVQFYSLLAAGGDTNWLMNAFSFRNNLVSAIERSPELLKLLKPFTPVLDFKVSFAVNYG